jgi:hypothetical protein
MPFVSSVRGSYGSQGKRRIQTGRIGLGTTGGTVVLSGGYRYHIFSSVGTSTFSPDSPGLIEALIIAGGGGGGSSFGGGGGAGGVVYASYNQPGTNAAVVVGAGAPQNTAADSIQGLTGDNSSVFGFTALGGGGGGAYNNAYNGSSGGSGGGGGSSETSGTMSGGAATQTSGSGFTGYGNRGGNSFGRSPYIGTGGGGAGAQGQDISGGTTAGNGGSGTNLFSTWLSAINSSMSGVSGWSTATSGGYIAGGGAGASYQYSNGSLPGQPGAGGGGTSTGGNSVRGGNAIANTGSGGGGGGYPQGGGGAGGSGLVIIRYTV